MASKQTGVLHSSVFGKWSDHSTRIILPLVNNWPTIVIPLCNNVNFILHLLAPVIHVKITGPESLTNICCDFDDQGR